MVGAGVSPARGERCREKGESRNRAIAGFFRLTLYHIWNKVYHIWYKVVVLEVVAVDKIETGNVVEFKKKQKYWVIVDKETGEIEAYVPVKEKTLGGGWVAVYQDSMRVLAEDKTMTGEQYRVMLKLFSILDYQNYIKVSQKELAESLDMRQAHVSRAIIALMDRDIIREGPRAGMNKTYRLNPYIGHKGKNRDQTIVDFQDLQKRKKNKKS